MRANTKKLFDEYGKVIQEPIQINNGAGSIVYNTIFEFRTGSGLFPEEYDLLYDQIEEMICKLQVEKYNASL